MSKTKTLLDEDTKSFREAKKLALSPFRRRKLMAAVRSDATVTRSALVTLEALLDHAGDDAHKCWPSQKRLAEMTHVHYSTIQRHLTELEDAGYLLVFRNKPRQNPKTGQYKRKTNRYYFCSRKKDGIGKRKRRSTRPTLSSEDAVCNPLVIETPASLEVGGGSSSSFYKNNGRYNRSNPKFVHPQPLRFNPNKPNLEIEEDIGEKTSACEAKERLSSMRSRLR